MDHLNISLQSSCGRDSSLFLSIFFCSSTAPFLLPSCGSGLISPSEHILPPYLNAGLCRVSSVMCAVPHTGFQDGRSLLSLFVHSVLVPRVRQTVVSQSDAVLMELSVSEIRTTRDKASQQLNNKRYGLS